MKGMKRALTALCCLLLLLPAFSALAEDSFSMARDGFSTSYTYNYDYWGDVQMTPDAYRVSDVLDAVSLGLENLEGKRFSRPQSLFVRNQDLYIADSGNNRIVQLRSDGKSFSVFRVITAISGCENSTLNNPTDIFVDAGENLYIADCGNQRVVMVDKDLNWIKEFTKPQDATYDQNLDFQPRRITVDVAGRVYVLATNVNKGFVKYENDTSFTGYIGANKVSVNMADYIWKRYFQTKEQRAASESFVPTEYENLYMDKEGFIYATTTVFSEYDLKSDAAKPIRCLNGVGDDILVKNDRYPPIGDLYWQQGGSVQYGPSRLTDITVLDNDIYIALDRTRGRLFGYDDQGIMLWAFGTKGNTDGAFTGAVSLEHMGYQLLVLDQLKSTVTVFSPTEYGMMIYQAIEAYSKGNYDQSAELWRGVMKLNANYPLAFRGIGQALLWQKDYGEAMNNFEKAHDRRSYGQAFKYFRKQWVERNVLWIVLVLAAVLIVGFILGRIRKWKWEVMVHEHNKVHKNA